MDLPDKDRMCHHTGFKASCRKLVTDGKCCRWMQITGSNPNTGEAIARHNCIDDWIPFLLMENSQQQRQTGAAVESFRNDMVKLNVNALNSGLHHYPHPHPQLAPTRPDSTLLIERDPNTLDLFNGEKTHQ